MVWRFKIALSSLAVGAVAASGLFGAPVAAAEPTPTAETDTATTSSEAQYSKVVWVVNPATGKLHFNGPLTHEGAATPNATVTITDTMDNTLGTLTTNDEGWLAGNVDLPSTWTTASDYGVVLNMSGDRTINVRIAGPMGYVGETTASSTFQPFRVLLPQLEAPADARTDTAQQDEAAATPNAEAQTPSPSASASPTPSAPTLSAEESDDSAQPASPEAAESPAQDENADVDEASPRDEASPEAGATPSAPATVEEDADPAEESGSAGSAPQESSAAPSPAAAEPTPIYVRPSPESETQPQAEAEEQQQVAADTSGDDQGPPAPAPDQPAHQSHLTTQLGDRLAATGGPALVASLVGLGVAGGGLTLLGNGLVEARHRRNLHD